MDRTGLTRAIRASLAVAAAAAGLTATGASAVVAPPHGIAVLANASGLEIGGYPGEIVTAQVIRNGVVVGSASGAPLAGDLNVNPTICWSGFVPEILPGDTIRASSPQFPVPDETVVRDLSVQHPVVEPGTNDLVIHGTAQDHNGDPLPLDEIANRVISTTEDFHLNGGVRLGTGHPGAPGEGVIAYDAPGSIHWTARYSGLDLHDRTLAQASTTEVRGLWANADASEVTIMIAGATPAAVAPCLQPVSRFGVTQADPPAVNAANSGIADVAFSGMSTGAVDGQLTVDDTDPFTAPYVAAIAPAPALGAQTWTVVVPVGVMSGFAQGPIRAQATFTTAGGTVVGTPLEIAKDLVAPNAPTSTPVAGVLTGPQWVTLHHDDPSFATQVRYTLDGTDPTPDAPVASGLIPVTHSLTIRAIAVDGVGNVSPVAIFPFTVVPPPPPPPPAPPPMTPVASVGPTPTPSRPALTRVRSVCVPLSRKVSPRVRCRAEIRSSLSRSATLRFVVRTRAGRLVGVFVRTGRPGANRTVLPRRVGRTLLRPGRYRVSVTATAQRLSSARARVVVTVPPRR